MTVNVVPVAMVPDASFQAWLPLSALAGRMAKARSVAVLGQMSGMASWNSDPTVGGFVGYNPLFAANYPTVK